MIDAQGFRLNVGIILANSDGRLLWAKRSQQHAWQFPQGGMQEDEEPEDSMFRELEEEVGLKETDVSIIGRTRSWLRYRIPRRLLRESLPICIGQKQIWFLLRLLSEYHKIKLDTTSKPEFDDYRWVSYWFPLREVVAFKREVYRKALLELAPYLHNTNYRGASIRPINHLLEEDYNNKRRD